MDAILSNSAAANNSLSSESRSALGYGQLLLDHARRVARAIAGLGVFGFGWLLPWFAYCVSPFIRRLLPGRIVHFKGFNVRLGECDLDTFGNVFTDYPVAELSNALRHIELVVDLGANVGAFLFLVRRLCKKDRRHPRIVAVEPAPENVAFLRTQPFAEEIEICHAAVGPSNGTARLVRGANSVTHHVDFSDQARGELVQVLSLKALCRRPALVKMDIEGGERCILKHGLPANVRHLVLEWHGKGQPSDLVAGNWRKISADIYGSTMWWLAR